MAVPGGRAQGAPEVVPEPLHQGVRALAGAQRPASHRRPAVSRADQRADRSPDRRHQRHPRERCGELTSRVEQERPILSQQDGPEPQDQRHPSIGEHCLHLLWNKDL